jgi:hypothetical protein
MRCVDLRTELEDGVVSINNHDRLVLEYAGQEIPLAPACHGDRMMRDNASTRRPVILTTPPTPPA